MAGFSQEKNPKEGPVSALEAGSAFQTGILGSWEQHKVSPEIAGSKLWAHQVCLFFLNPWNVSLVVANIMFHL